MTNQIEKKENLFEDYNINLYVTAIDGEKLSITFKTFNMVRKDIKNAKIGDFLGTIDVLYPVAGLNVTLTLEVYHDFVEEFEAESGVFKLPFVNKLVSIIELEYELYHSQSEFEGIQEQYEKCSCGGNMRPMYDDFPNWITFCTKCDNRTEDFDYSPLP
ncbi:hypothetical protein D7X33_19180 [Butyricicoccus sp. 1XD8-22]|nr:hypothetical protein D7X33_19180 [Butyricicoccus sp. 1XD8-22]